MELKARNKPLDVGRRSDIKEQTSLLRKNLSSHPQTSGPTYAMDDQDTGNTILHVAAKKGDVDAVRGMLASRRYTRELTETNKDNWLPLHLAVDNGHEVIVGDLVAAMVNDGQGDKLNGVCSYPLQYGYREQWTALHIAVYRGFIGCIEQLKHLDSTIVDRRDYRPIHLAAESRNTDVLEAYLKTFPSSHGAELNITNVFGLTPLMFSAALGNVEAVTLLIKYGADVEVAVPDGSDESVKAKRQDHCGQNVLHIIVKRSVEEPNSVQKYRAVYEAIVSGCTSTTDKLTNMIKHVARSCSFRPRFERRQMTVVEFGAAIGAVDLTSMMIHHLSQNSNDAEQLVKCLHVAANFGHAHIVSVVVETLSRLGLSNRANDKLDFPLEFGYKERWTALHVAVYRGHIDCIRELRSLDPQIPDKRNFQAVHLAADSKLRNVLEVFLQMFSHKNDPQLDAVNSFGLTPIMLCAALGNADGVKLLIEYGADVEMVVPEGSTESERAKRSVQLGQNVLHMIVKRSVEETNNIAKYLEVYRLIVQPYVENNSIPYLNEYLLQSKGTCSFGERFRNKSLTVIQLAAAVGAADMLDAMVDTLLVDNTCKEYCDLALKYLVPGAVSGEKHKSCLELISSHCTLSEMVNMERIQPMTTYVSRFARARTIAFCVFLVFHMIHMSFLTRVTTTLGAAADWSNSTESSRDPSTSCASSLSYNNYYWMFLIWPSLLLVYETTCGVISVIRSISSRNNHDSLLPEPSQYRIVYLDVIAHIATVIFSLLMITWYLYGRYGSSDECPTFDPRRRVGLSAVLLVWGWMQTLEYIRYPQKLHTFVAILKVIFIKDVFYISLIYAFVLVGFAAAIYVYLLTDDAGTLEMTFADCIYHVYTTMLGDGKLFDNDVVSGSDSHMVRSVFAIYLCLSIVVLLNMLIAMMNNRYSNVLDMRRSLWYIETVNGIAWVSYVIRFDRCRCLFEIFAAGVRKPIKVEPNDEFRRLHDRIDELEANFEDVRNKLEENIKMYAGHDVQQPAEKR